MIGMYAITAAALVAVGIALGIVIIVSVGIRREQPGRLTPDSPGHLASGARAVNGLYIR